MTVHRVWKDYHIQPHRTQSFPLRTDPRFEAKGSTWSASIGIPRRRPWSSRWMRSPRGKRWNALRRSSRWGRTSRKADRRTFARPGTIDLFAALTVLDGTAVTEFRHRHRHQEFLSFLRPLDE